MATQEDRVNSQLADCNRRAEVELEILGAGKEIHRVILGSPVVPFTLFIGSGL